MKGELVRLSHQFIRLAEEILQMPSHVFHLMFICMSMSIQKIRSCLSFFSSEEQLFVGVERSFSSLQKHVIQVTFVLTRTML